ncbi:hypothetical protein [Flavihumibacter petaseus]|uniref:Uncharacterized protein n=1 Tax=Flavihumibacter petaseus NBRC 106054 TaxID=1220578 RepID=A0A0E9MWH5_9BACT|nr:hypothetical protein [Flavihumibacter petaseus]GAO41455.1 hypothetical protein FPE01S_01_04680 [Flavihumibacter petaseus NBRC 106054]
MSLTKTADKGRPDYYITPTQDFTQYTRDAEQKYWNRETKFDWQQDVRYNLKIHLEQLEPAGRKHIFMLVLPMVAENIDGSIRRLRAEGIPIKEDALKALAECLPENTPSIGKALELLAPFSRLQKEVQQLRDRQELLNDERLVLQEHQRLGYIRRGTTVQLIRSAEERQEQEVALVEISGHLKEVTDALHRYNGNVSHHLQQLSGEIRSDLTVILPYVLHDLQEMLMLVQQTLVTGRIPEAHPELRQLQDLVLQRQLRGLRDIANHALVVEQSAIAPLTMGIIHYRRYREIQEAMTTFINDEAKHSATFRRFLVEKLQAKEFIAAKLIKGAKRYMWLARFMPGTGLFLAVIVEAIGAAYLEFFGNEKYMPDKLFCSISRTISEQDETRHMDLCVAMYNELFRRGKRWEKLRNKVALKVLMKSVYGDKTDDHHLIQAFRAFGVGSDVLYRHITGRLSQQLTRIGMYVTPEEMMLIIGRQ